MASYSPLPRERAAYILVVMLPVEAEARIAGRSVNLQPGVYLYVGSAGGPGGLASRIKRHLSRGKKPRWHIDWLTNKGDTTAVLACIHEEPREAESCLAWCLALRGLPFIPRFGSSDDRSGAPSHLYGPLDAREASLEAALCMEKCCREGRLLAASLAGTGEPG